MGVNMRVYGLLGYAITDEQATELFLEKDYEDDYEANHLEIARKIANSQSIKLVYDGMSGQHHYLGKVFMTSDDARYEMLEFYESLDAGKLVLDFPLVKKEVDNILIGFDPALLTGELIDPPKIHIFTHYT